MPAKATKREWLALVVLVIPTLLVSMDMTVTYLALPEISAALKPTSAQLLWVTDIYSFSNAGLLIVMGTLGDRIGLRRLLLTGGLGFAAASVLAAFSTSAVMLILARGLLGVSGATLLTSTISIIRNIFRNDQQRTFAMGLYTTCFSSGTMLGPLVGGMLLSHFWWGSVFLIAVPLMIILLTTAPLLLPEFKNDKGGKIDALSTALLIIAILSFTYGIKQMAQDGFTLLPLLFAVAGFFIAIIFYRRQTTLASPLIDIKLFNKASFTIALIALFIALFSWSGIYLFIGQYLQLVQGLNAFKAGLYTMPGALGSIVLCMLAPAMLRYVSRGHLIAWGMMILATGIALMALLSTTSLTMLITSAILMSGGCGLVVTLGIDMVVSSAPPEKAGAAAGISETSTGFGSALGIAILGSLWTVLYRSNVNSILPAGINSTNKETMRNTLGGAVEVARVLNNTALIAAARDAFIQALHVTAGICAGIVLLTALLVRFKLKNV